MPRYKRTRDDAELDLLDLEPAVPPESVETLTKLRNMWEFASLMQYIFLFGDEVKVDKDLDIEDLEQECLKPTPSDKLAQMGLALLKYVSSHRGLTLEIFDEYARRQYLAKAPQRNPFGDLEEPSKFNDFDVFTKVRVLHQLSTWTLGNAERIRGLMPDDEDQLNWRMEPLGWDKNDAAYFVLDDNRLYRRADEPVPPPAPKPKVTPKPKARSKPPRRSGGKATRSSKRLKLEETSEEEFEEQDAEDDTQEDTLMANGEDVDKEEEPGFGFTSKTWECVAIDLDEYNDFLATIFRSRDANEKQLRRRIEEDVLPIIEKRAEMLKAKQLRRLRELENLQKMATAKRSSRLADKAEKEVKEREDREAEERKHRELKMVLAEQERQRKIEEGHESRRLTREQRLKEREVKRILHEEELARIAAEESRTASQDPSSDAGADGEKRTSQRHLKTQKEQHERELEKLAEDEDTWYFDCVVCGVHGDDLDDGTHSIACERCNVWQHSKCHGFSPEQAEDDGFHFVCSTCKRKEEDAKKPKIPPIKLSKNRASNSPDAQRTDSRPSTANGQPAGKLPDHVQRQLDGGNIPRPHPESPGPFGQLTNGPNFSPFSQRQTQPGYRYPPVGNFAPQPPYQELWQGNQVPPSVQPPSAGYTGSPQPPVLNSNSSPHHQQHQQVHQNAVAASGGHPAYRPTPFQASVNGDSPRGLAVQRGNSHSPVQHRQVHPGHQTHAQSAAHSSQSPPSSHHRSIPPTHLMNGFQSPVKQRANPASSSPPPQQQNMLSSAQSSAPSQLSQASQRLFHSPQSSFPPPQTTYAHQGAQSPVKSSPPAPRRQSLTPLNSSQPRHMHVPASLTSQNPPQIAPLQQRSGFSVPSQTPPSRLGPTSPLEFRPSSSSGAHVNVQTPQQVHPSPASANATSVAADGMSGPWPQSSTAIPQKHDQSPAPLPPPLSNPSMSEAKVMPPVQLAPSPIQQQSVPQTVPVKKLPEENGIPQSPIPSAASLEHKPLAPSPSQQMLPAPGSIPPKVSAPNTEPLRPSQGQ